MLNILNRSCKWSSFPNLFSLLAQLKWLAKLWQKTHLLCYINSFWQIERFNSNFNFSFQMHIWSCSSCKKCSGRILWIWRGWRKCIQCQQHYHHCQYLCGTHSHHHHYYRGHEAQTDERQVTQVQEVVTCHCWWCQGLTWLSLLSNSCWWVWMQGTPLKWKEYKPWYLIIFYNWI